MCLRQYLVFYIGMLWYNTVFQAIFVVRQWYVVVYRCVPGNIWCSTVVCCGITVCLRQYLVFYIGMLWYKAVFEAIFGVLQWYVVVYRCVPGNIWCSTVVCCGITLCFRQYLVFYSGMLWYNAVLQAIFGVRQWYVVV